MSFHQYGVINKSKSITNIKSDNYKRVTPITISQKHFVHIIKNFKDLNYSIKYITLFKENGSFVNNNSDVKIINEMNNIKNKFSLSQYLEENNYFIGSITIGDGENSSITVSNSGKIQLHGENDLLLDLLLESLE